MQPDAFWKIIDPIPLKTEEEVIEILSGELSKLDPNDVLGFRDQYLQRFTEGYSYELWGAACVINGGCSDDAFSYWHQGLVLHGEKIFKSALNDPDSLAGVEDPGYYFQYMMQVPREVYEDLTGDEMPDSDWALPEERSGVEWPEDFSDYFLRLYPRLSERFGPL